MLYRDVFDKISTEFRSIFRVFVNFAGFRGFTWISRLCNCTKYLKPWNINNHRAEIRRNTLRCWQKCWNFHNPARDNVSWVSSKLGQIIAKFSYILLPKIKYDCFDILNHFYGCKRPSRDTLACSRLRESQVRWIEKVQTQKENGRKLGKAGAVEPVIISLNDPFQYTSSWYTLWLVRFDRLYQHS